MASSKPCARVQKLSIGRGAMCALPVAVFLFVSALAAFAQGERGAIAGTVTDQKGAAVSAAPIQAKNMKTGTIYKAASSTAGKFTLEQLPAGTYELSIPLPEFVYHRQTVVVQAAQTLLLDIHVEDNSLNALGEDRAYFAGLVAPRATRSAPAARPAATSAPRRTGASSGGSSRGSTRMSTTTGSVTKAATATRRQTTPTCSRPCTFARMMISVSYTHLTLPTIYSV